MRALISAVGFLCFLAGSFAGPTLDRWFGEPREMPQSCVPTNDTQRAIVTYRGECHIQPVKPWRRTT